ncbi:peptidoglycan-binding protein [Roseomonas sp. CCTCC AB2023176]|uniref:peptidoglycan-binding domain-containing protein n=1 Tax=Roseomonas sp. CCTCC AB2023176 TaxID=3342640 RepID=UPI0035D9ECCB
MGLELDGATRAFTFLRQGDVLPAVTTGQVLMRRHGRGATITCDGQFGPRTRAAVAGYQGGRGLVADGVIGPKTWNSLMAVSGFQTIDLVDGTDPSLITYEAKDIRDAGGDPIIVYGQSNGLLFAMSQIASRAQTGKVMLLRIHGHGGKGVQNVTGGEINGAPHMASISLDRFEESAMALLMIRRIFVGFGCVQLLGCNVGGGPKGKELVGKLARTWGVPVTAGIQTQFAGGSQTFRFEGPTVSGFPNGMDLASWSASAETMFGNVSMAA